MSRAKKDENPKRKGIRSWWIVLLCVVLALTAIAVAVGILRHKHSLETVVEEERSALLDSLHVFPPVDFADSLCQSHVVATYEDDAPRDVFYYEIDSAGNTTRNVVHERHYYPSRQKFMDGNVHNGKRNGLWYAYHPNGNVQTMAYYVDGLEEGRYTVYHPNGAVYYTGEYHHGKCVGTWLFYDDEEHLVEEKHYDAQ